MRDAIGKLIKAKRTELKLTQEQLAQKAEVPYTTLTKIESGVIRNPSARVIQKLSASLGISTDSVLSPTLHTGLEALQYLFSDILSTLNTPGEFMCVSGIEEGRFLKADQKIITQYIKELKKKGITQKLLSCEGDQIVLEGDHLEYRWIPKEYFNPNPIYAYGNKIAALLWGPPLQVMIIDNEVLTDAYRRQFLFMWENAQRKGM